jgi:phage terminase large subunit-like protein
MPLDQADWSTAVPDWESRILEGRSLIPDLPLFEPSAEKALRIFDRLRVPDLPGTPLRKDVSPAWVREYIATIFGCYDPATRRRMIQEFFLMIPKKNTKSDLAATIILIAAIMNDRPKAELVLIAPSHNVAEIAFEQIAGMIALDRDLGGPDGLGKEGGVFLVQTHLKKITHKTTKATIEIESADGDIVTGSKAAYVLVDETHELAAKAKAGKVLLELRGGLASRPEGFFLQITTQSKIEPQGQFKKELQEARAVRDGTVKSPLLAVIYEFPPKMQKSQKWMDESTWGMVNPNLNVSVDLAFLRKEFDKAKRAGMEDVAMFASQHLNVEVGLGLHSERWVAADYWPKCGYDGLTLEELIDRCEVAVVGGDIGGADDLLGFGVIGREKETRHWLHWAHAWCTEDALDRRKEIAPKLLDLAEAGNLTIDDDIHAHVTGVADICDQLLGAGLLPAEGAIGLDPYGTAALLDELAARGYPDEMFYAVGQGFKLNGAIKTLERRTYQRTLRHGNQPLMTWCMGNAKAEARGNNIMITKAKAGTAKIDPLIAMFNATILMDMNPEAIKKADISAFLSNPVMIA